MSETGAPPADRAEAAPAHADALPETVVERICRGLCELTLAAMVVLIAAEVVARQFNFSFEFVDEVGGYLLAALTFFGLPVALVGGAYHHVEYFRQRLGPRGRAALGLAFTVMALAFVLVLEWQLWRLVTRSWGADVRASTILGTPLWLPQSAMLLGTGALAFSLLRVAATQWRMLRHA